MIEYLWIPVTLVAACMQVTRTALQKRISRDLNDWAVTWIRYSFAMPWIVALWLAMIYMDVCPQMNQNFLLFSLLAGIAQIVATILLVALFSRRSFAVSTVFAKIEALQIALLGVLFFGEAISPLGFWGVLAGAAGLLLMTPIRLEKITLRNMLQVLRMSTGIMGLLSGTLFALTSLFIRQAYLQLEEPSPFIKAAATLVVMVCLQTLLLGLWLAIRHRQQFAIMPKTGGLCAAIGLTSFAGSMGWFVGFALTHPAYVKTLAQVELPLAFLIGLLFFKESCTRKEIIGMLTIAFGSIIVIWA